MSLLDFNDKKGVYVDTIYSDSPAIEANLKPHDVITMLDDQKIEAASELLSIISSLAPGETVKMEVLRDIVIVPLEITVQKRPKPSQ